MGSCCAIKRGTILEKYISSKLSEAIEQNNPEKLKELIKKYTTPSQSKASVLNINSPIVKIYSHDMNALGYSLFLGYLESFTVILELGKAKLSAMSKLYLALNKRPIDVICELGHKSLLEYYLPIYLNKNDQAEESDSEEVSLSLNVGTKTKSQINDKYKLNNSPITLSPLHRACDKGRINIIQYIIEYFQGKSVPNEFDIHCQDEVTGDNCALVSCKAGNLDMIKFLFETCKADFHIFNKRKESAVQVMAVWSKKRKQKKFLECFRYLIETICVDFTYEYEETLLILEDREIIEYLEEKLRKEGIFISKSRVDDFYSINKNKMPVLMEPALEFKLSKVRGPRFNFRELFEDEFEESKDAISSIEFEMSIQSVSYLTFLDGK